MKTIFIAHCNLQDIYKTAPNCVMALGYFDGLHKGHQEVIKVARKQAEKRGIPLAVMSFRPHPIEILSRGKRQVPNLMRLFSKQKKLEDLGVDLFYLVEFTEQFANLSPQQFVQDYLVRLQVQHAVAGFDFCYGIKGKGKLKDIFVDSNEQIHVTEVDCVHIKGEKISSTAIRSRLKNSFVHEIPYFLGSYYEMSARWNGLDLQIFEDVMLPRAGYYEVLISSREQAWETDLLVQEDGRLKCLHRLPKSFEGIVTIQWLRATQNMG